MRLASLLTASVVAVGLAAAASTSQAATLAPPKGLVTSHQSLATNVYYRRYCWRWRHICADRWGWGGPGFRRCMWRHGC